MPRTAKISGPFVEPRERRGMKSVHNKDGAHYNTYYLDSDGGRPCSEAGMESLKELFPEGKADDLNFCLFSTSGIHGSYLKIEDIEKSLNKYGEDPEFEDDDEPDDYTPPELTVLVVHPRLVCLRCGNVRVRKADIPWLKKLRESSQTAVKGIGFD